MHSAPEIVFTVTNDLSYDQRMNRICSTLATAGYHVTLVGRQLPSSLPLAEKAFKQVRLKCQNQKGKLFYLEYNWRLFRFLKKCTIEHPDRNLALCAIDLDTILPVLAVSKKRKLPRVYDAHELFTELIEVKRRRIVSDIWHLIERIVVPKFRLGYTVNDFIAAEFNRRYGVNYEVIRNMPLRKQPGPGADISQLALPQGKFFLYQGAVNEGRSFETLIPAMKEVNAPLMIAGDGNFLDRAKAIVGENQLADKIIFTGMLEPGVLNELTPHAFAGLTIFEGNGLNQYYSLANRYFDYIQAKIPQVCVNYPEYAALNNKHATALLINDVLPKTIAAAMNKILEDDVLYKNLQNACNVASEDFCWENESHKLTNFWKAVLPLKPNVEQIV